MIEPAQDQPRDPSPSPAKSDYRAREPEPPRSAIGENVPKDRFVISAGWLLTAAYLLFVALPSMRNWNSFLELSPNEWGDFLAGVFSPLAFLWLVVGYQLQRHQLSLQGRELKLQTDELFEARAVATLQADAQKNQADAMAHLAEFTRLQLELQEKAIRVGTRPRFEIKVDKLDANRLLIGVTNVGAPAFGILFRVDNGWELQTRSVQEGGDFNLETDAYTRLLISRLPDGLGKSARLQIRFELDAKSDVLYAYEVQDTFASPHRITTTDRMREG